MVEDNDELLERMRIMREHLAVEEIDEIVRWQMTGVLMKKSPVHNTAPPPRCHRCLGEWHGLPSNDGCPGSFDTPEGDW